LLERERERVQKVCVYESGREREYVYVLEKEKKLVCVYEREREKMFVCER